MMLERHAIHQQIPLVDLAPLEKRIRCHRWSKRLDIEIRWLHCVVIRKWNLNFMEL